MSVTIPQFKSTVWKYYAAHGRHDLLWRKNTTSYRILVSEIMLQQTQVSRAIPKFKNFMQLFPNVRTLSNATLAEVLRAWQGLGYNRRAKYLHQAAKMVVALPRGKFPDSFEDLLKLPGVGGSTAGAIVAYAHNRPSVFIETNIRRAFIHAFFSEADSVSDADLAPYILKCVKDEPNPREWYWALMDYGSMLGNNAKLMNPNRKSKHYTKQSIFLGSRRQQRGIIIKKLLDAGNAKPLSSAALEVTDSTILDDMVREGLLIKKSKTYRLAE